MNEKINIMKPLFALVALLAIANCQLMAQSTSAPKFDKEIRLYFNSSINTSFLRHSGLETFEFGRMTPAFRLTGQKGWFHEFELTHIGSITTHSNRVFPDSPIITGRHTYFAARYEFGKSLWLSANAKHQILASAFVSPRMGVYRESQPNNNLRSRYLGLDLGLAVRYQYHLNDHWTIDANLPLNGLASFYHSSSNENFSNSHFSAFDFYQLNPRLGISYKF